jgi:hypothetical protein
MERWTNHALVCLFQFWKDEVGPFNRETWPRGAVVPRGFDENRIAETVFRRMEAAGVVVQSPKSLLEQIRAAIW